MKPRRNDADRWTLLDRVAVGALYGVLAIVTGSFVWLMGAVWIRVPDFPFAWVLWFTAGAVFLGFCGVDKFIADLFGSIWQSIRHL
jgi:hypothetical protein